MILVGAWQSQNYCLHSSSVLISAHGSYKSEGCGQKHQVTVLSVSKQRSLHILIIQPPNHALPSCLQFGLVTLLWHSNTDKIGKLKYMIKLESDIWSNSNM